MVLVVVYPEGILTSLRLKVGCNRLAFKNSSLMRDKKTPLLVHQLSASGGPHRFKD